MTEVARYTFHVSSSQRLSGTNTDMNIQFSQIITRLAKGSRFQVVVHGITIPFSFYQLSSDIAALSVRIVQGANTYNGSITLTTGNYTTISVLAELTARLTTLCQSSISPCTSFTPTFNFSYSTTTGLSTLAMTSATIASSVVTLRFSLNSNLALFFGFSADAVFSTSMSATSTQPAVANPVSYLLLRSPSLRQYKNREWIVEKDAFSDILYRIPIQTNAGTYITWYGDSEPVLIVNDNISLVNFYLTTNLSYTPIDLKSLPWSFHFTIIELVQDVYDSLFSTAFVNQPFYSQPLETDANDAERQQLEKERDEALKRLDVYMKKLKPKQDVVLQREGRGDSNFEPSAEKPVGRRPDKGQPKDSEQE